MSNEETQKDWRKGPRIARRLGPLRKVVGTYETSIHKDGNGRRVAVVLECKHALVADASGVRDTARCQVCHDIEQREREERKAARGLRPITVNVPDPRIDALESQVKALLKALGEKVDGES